VLKEFFGEGEASGYGFADKQSDRSVSGTSKNHELLERTSKYHEPQRHRDTDAQRHREKRGKRKASPVFSPLTFSVPLCLKCLTGFYGFSEVP
jgi:hypothetical protein